MVGLVLEGGGMRSLFSEGVIDAMMESGVRFDGIIGVSAGALFGCNMKSHQPQRALRYNIRFMSDPRYMGFRSFITTGNFVNAQFAYHTVPLELDVFDNPTFKSDSARFHLVCTDIDSGETIVKEIQSVDDETLEWFRATGSMPIVSTPVCLEGRRLLDGGMTDCIPLRRFQQMGYGRNVVVLTQPREYVKRPTRLTPLFRLLYPRQPQIARCMASRHEMYNSERRYAEQQATLGTTLLIYPDAPLSIGRTEQDEHKMRSVYQQGYDKAMQMMDEIKQFVNNEAR